MLNIAVFPTHQRPQSHGPESIKHLRISLIHGVCIYYDYNRLEENHRLNLSISGYRNLFISFYIFLYLFISFLYQVLYQIKGIFFKDLEENHPASFLILNTD